MRAPHGWPIVGWAALGSVFYWPFVLGLVAALWLRLSSRRAEVPAVAVNAGTRASTR